MISTTENLGGQSQAFASFVELQQQHTELSNQLDQLEVTINRDAQASAKASAEAYIVLQENIAALDIKLKAFFAAHPEWRGEKKKSVSTPFGSVEQRTANELEVPNAAMTVAMIEACGKSDAAFKADDFLHVSKEPNLEALERLDDSALAKLGINRVTTERVTVKPAKVSVAKAVKAAKAKVGK